MIISNVMDTMLMKRLAKMRRAMRGVREDLVHKVFAARLHEAEHVEEAVVAGRGEALTEAHVRNELSRYPNNLLRSAATQALHKQRCQALQYKTIVIYPIFA